MRVPNEVRDCCGFIYATKNNQKILVGTGFFIMERFHDNLPEHLGFPYFITAKHNIDAIKIRGFTPMGIRFTSNNAGIIDVEVPLDSWLYSDDTSVDAALVPFHSVEGLNVVALPLAMNLSEEYIKQYDVGIGDEVIITGLFTNHHGKDRILPILRTGNIAMMPEEPVKTSHYGNMKAYLIELRSLGGLSGSPVFVHKLYPNGQNILFWMGLLHGHWNLDQTKIDYVGDSEPLNVGIGVVVPSISIIPILESEVLMKAKDNARKEIKKHGLPQEDISADNFHAILDKASKPKGNKDDNG